ncbi:MAG: caspase family protein [Myxococcales bacterium]|nr:caspase family protein [Myxococcales bacterium]
MGTWLLGMTVGAVAVASPQRALEVQERDAPPVEAGKRVALVVGNGAYQHTGVLPQAPADAEAVAQALRALHYEVRVVQDVGYRSLSKAIADFGADLRGAEVGLFYYAGHAVQVGDVNYMVPIDAELSDPDYAESDAVDAGRVLDVLQRARTPVSVVVLDACRNNPFASSWRSSSRSFGTRGLSQMSARGVLLAYATNPGNTAQDSGVFARALTKYMAAPCLSLVEVFSHVRDNVLQATGGTQEPWIGGSVGTAFHAYRPGGCDAEPTQVVVTMEPAVAPAAPDDEITRLERTLTEARRIYRERCVEALQLSTAGERKRCHARYGPVVAQAEQALDRARLRRAAGP